MHFQLIDSGLESASWRINSFHLPIELPRNIETYCIYSVEAAPGFEPGIKDLQSSALPLGYAAKKFSSNGAENGIRTRDPNLGKVVLYR